VAFTELMADAIHCLLKICSEVLSVNEKGFFLEKRLQLFALTIEVSDCIISSILASVLSRESESVGSSVSDRDSVVNEVYVFSCPLFVVPDEPVVEMSGRDIVSTVFIIAYKLMRLRHAYLSDDR